jgi:hypothetical protein
MTLPAVTHQEATWNLAVDDFASDFPKGRSARISLQALN